MRYSYGFNSLAPRGANPVFKYNVFDNLEFQLTRPAGGEPLNVCSLFVSPVVSTHSPRGGRTLCRRDFDAGTQGFNSLAPRGANRFPYPSPVIE